MKIRTVVPKRYIDVLQRGEDVDINMYDEGELIEGYKFDADYFRERIANVLVVEHTEDFAVVFHPLTKELELHNVTEGTFVNWPEVEEGDARRAQEVVDLADTVTGTPHEVVEEIFNETATDKFFIAEVLYGG